MSTYSRFHCIEKYSSILSLYLDYANITLTASTDKKDELLKELQDGYTSPIPYVKYRNNCKRDMFIWTI